MKYLIILIAFVPIMSIAQKCNYELNTVDKFTKQTKIEKEIKLNRAFAYGHDGHLRIKICKYNSQIFFRITYYQEYKVMIVSASDALIFLFDDGTTITAHPNQIYSSESSGKPSEILHATYKFNDESEFQKLKTNKIKPIRIYYNSVYKDIDVKDSYRNTFLKAANCF